MEAAMREHSILSKDDEARKCMEDYFRYTGKHLLFIIVFFGSLVSKADYLCHFKAHYIVVASKFMRTDQVRC